MGSVFWIELQEQGVNLVSESCRLGLGALALDSSSSRTAVSSSGRTRGSSVDSWRTSRAIACASSWFVLPGLWALRRRRAVQRALISVQSLPGTRLPSGVVYCDCRMQALVGVHSDRDHVGLQTGIRAVG